MSDHRHQRCDAGAAGDEDNGATIRRRPREMSTDRAANLKGFARLEFVRNERGHLSIG